MALARLKIQRAELIDADHPAPGSRDVILEIKASGMCGSDLGPYRVKFKPGVVRSQRQQVLA